jgi:hypothetical protein
VLYCAISDTVHCTGVCVCVCVRVRACVRSCVVHVCECVLCVWLARAMHCGSSLVVVAGEGAKQSFFPKLSGFLPLLITPACNTEALVSLRVCQYLAASCGLCGCGCMRGCGCVSVLHVVSAYSMDIIVWPVRVQILFPEA